METDEIWADIPEYDGYYQASNFGRIKSLSRQYIGSMGRICNKKERIIKGGFCGSNKNKDKRYAFVCISINGVKKNRYIHQLVYESFKGFYDKDIYEINHKDGNKKNNRLDNLEITTPIKNMLHAKENGLLHKHEEHYSSVPVIQMDIHGRFMAEYASILLAGKINNLDPSGISKACDKKHKNYSTSGGFKWEYKLKV